MSTHYAKHAPSEKKKDHNKNKNFFKLFDFQTHNSTEKYLVEVAV